MEVFLLRLLRVEEVIEMLWCCTSANHSPLVDGVLVALLLAVSDDFDVFMFFWKVM